MAWQASSQPWGHQSRIPGKMKLEHAQLVCAYLRLQYSLKKIKLCWHQIFLVHQSPLFLPLYVFCPWMCEYADWISWKLSDKRGWAALSLVASHQNILTLCTHLRYIGLLCMKNHQGFKTTKNIFICVLYIFCWYFVFHVVNCKLLFLKNLLI